ncbi:MAG: SPASM domain-containing protein, partial [Verrucomicrobiota bacterium]
MGRGLACCLNVNHVLGAYPRDSIKEMWHGAKARELREAIQSDDLSKGCGACAHQLLSRNFSGVVNQFDGLAEQAQPHREQSESDVAMPREL